MITEISKDWQEINGIKNMTKWEHTMIFLRCNICDNLNIHWSDRQEDLDLCKECYGKRWDKRWKMYSPKDNTSLNLQ